MGASNCLQTGFYTPPPKWHSRPPLIFKTCMSEKKKKNNNNNQPFNVIHKVPSGNSPYGKAKHAQLIEKDPNRAVALFWNAINSGDRVDSALKDMAVVMKQLDRSNEAIEAIKSFRHLCTPHSQESLDNVLVELYKCSGRLKEQIEVLQLKLKRLEEGHGLLGKKVKLSRSHGKKYHLTAEQEYARLLGNLAWAHLQQNDYKKAEDYYRKALSIETDRNKQCNLAICLIYMNRITEAKFLLQVIRDTAPKGHMDESYAKSFERASKLMAEMEGETVKSSSLEDDEIRNCCQNNGFFAFTPCQKPYESCESNWRKITDDHIDDLKDGQDFSQNETYTPSVQARKIPSSPLTQPQRSPFMLDCETWKSKKELMPDSPFTQPRRSSIMLDRGNCNNKNKNLIPESLYTQPKRSLGSLSDVGNKSASISYFSRRLQFGDISTDFLDYPRDFRSNCQESERHLSVESAQVKESDRRDDLQTTDPGSDKLSRSAAGVSPKACNDSCSEHCEGTFPRCNNTVRKSWADMVEEDEQEIMHPRSGA